MSDAIQALNECVFLAGRRDGEEVNPEDMAEHREKLLEKVAEVAGDALEDHVKAADRAKPRKQRVYKKIVDEIILLIDDCAKDTPEGPPYCIELIEELLANYAV